MPRRYWVDLTPTAVSAYTTDLLELIAADDKPIKIISVRLFQTSDFGDAQAEGLSVKWVRGNTSGGSGGTTVTPTPTRATDAAASFTAKSFNSTAASAGSPVVGPRHNFNVQLGITEVYSPEECIETSAGNYLVLRFEGSPADSLTVSGSVCVEEQG